MLTVRIQEKNYSESIMVLKLKDGNEKLDLQGFLLILLAKCIKLYYLTFRVRW